MSDARLRRLERAALHDPDAAARLEDERARLRPRLLPAVREQLLDGDGIARTTVAALLNGFEVVNRRDFLSPGFVPRTRGRVEFFRPGWEWIDPRLGVVHAGEHEPGGRGQAGEEARGRGRQLREAAEVRIQVAGMSAGIGAPVYMGDDGALRFDPLGTFFGVALQASPDANGTVTVRMGRQQARVDLAQTRTRRYPRPQP